MINEKRNSWQVINTNSVRILICLLAILLLMTAAPTKAHAASKKVKLSNTQITVIIGGLERQLTVYNTKKTVTWSSSKTSVATVTSDGTIKPKKEGKTTITAKVGKKTLKCKVTVICNLRTLADADAFGNGRSARSPDAQNIIPRCS